MYKTTWIIDDESDAGTFKTELTMYHFGKTPKFPNWYMKENNLYTIENVMEF